MQREIHSVPTLTYPSADGKPMAETDRHRKLMVDFIQAFLVIHLFYKMTDAFSCLGNILVIIEVNFFFLERSDQPFSVSVLPRTPSACD